MTARRTGFVGRAWSVRSLTARPWVRLALVVVVLAAAGVGVLATGLHERLEVGAVVAHLRGMGVWGVLLLVAGMIAAVLIGPVPTIPFTVAAGIVYGPVLGTLYAVLGAEIGAVLAFLIARYAARDAVIRLIGGDHPVLCGGCSQTLLVGIVFVTRLVPVVSFGVVSYAAGLTAMRIALFALATAVGMLPMTAVYVSAGSIITVGWGWALAGGLVVTALMLGLPYIVRRFDPVGLASLVEPAHKKAPRGPEDPSAGGP